ncbi:MAG: response regulator [Planctomycetota bacterium]|jgi:DNA-binding response OmpR family regulator
MENRIKKSILLVDDTPNNLMILVDTLNNAGYKTLIARSGERALYQISHHSPDLILLDVLMPGMDGFETCRRLKVNPATSKIPVIFITAMTDVENKIKGFEVGGVDYISKPFQQTEVLVRVNTHLTIHALQQQLEAHNAQLHEKNVQLEAALDKVKQLSGMLPICCNCKKIRNDKGYWQDVAVYVRDNSEAVFTHGMCPDCGRKLYPEGYEDEDE